MVVPTFKESICKVQLLAFKIGKLDLRKPGQIQLAYGKARLSSGQSIYIVNIIQQSSLFQFIIERDPSNDPENSANALLRIIGIQEARS
ncbi:hypothetical protein FH584_17760 [Leptospira interrogans]|uniref:hypothetical protein n=1 Tax=Leptospira interrogans TaxID=173 RepID=UPI001EF08A73|nr:hypothetical protein [Leptospira interrogans]ULG94335.1 hypothetical protein FH584_17760 [Leptospira interrogans]